MICDEPVIHAAETLRGMYLVYADGLRWQVRDVATLGDVPAPAAGLVPASGVRLTLRRPAEERTALVRPATVLTLHPDQGTCEGCGLALVPGAVRAGEDAVHRPRTRDGLRYRCAGSPDHRHHQAITGGAL